jgi:hypothetical protein
MGLSSAHTIGSKNTGVVGSKESGKEQRDVKRNPEASKAY